MERINAVLGKYPGGKLLIKGRRFAPAFCDTVLVYEDRSV